MLTPGSGFEPIHIAVVYGFSGAMHDVNKLNANEALLSKVFAEINAFEEVPGFISGDFNTNPDSSFTLATELHTGNWADVGLVQAMLLQTAPWNTYDNGRGSTSRIDLCFANACGMAMFHKFEALDDENCTIPFHKVQKLTVNISCATQRMLRPCKPKLLPNFDIMPPEDQEFLLMELLAKYMVPLDNANEENDVEEYWEQWCRLAHTVLLASVMTQCSAYLCTLEGEGIFALYNPQFIGNSTHPVVIYSLLGCCLQ